MADAFGTDWKVTRALALRMQRGQAVLYSGDLARLELTTYRQR